MDRTSILLHQQGAFHAAVIVSATKSGQHREDWSPDPLGNINGDANGANQITSTGFAYDRAGNMTADAAHDYVFDAWNRLVEVDDASGAKKVSELFSLAQSTTNSSDTFFPPQRIAAERQERSRPLLNGFHAWLEAEASKVLPKSAVRGAMDYTLSNWAALSVYPDDGWLDIDNNEGENSLRGLCIGRRNWLFCGSDRGGRAAAIHFSLLASCKRHGHDPWVYLRDVLTRLPAMLPGASDEELLPLLPHLWQPA